MFQNQSKSKLFSYVVKILDLIKKIKVSQWSQLVFIVGKMVSVKLNKSSQSPNINHVVQMGSRKTHRLFIKIIINPASSMLVDVIWAKRMFLKEDLCYFGKFILHWYFYKFTFISGEFGFINLFDVIKIGVKFHDWQLRPRYHGSILDHY